MFQLVTVARGVGSSCVQCLSIAMNSCCDLKAFVALARVAIMWNDSCVKSISCSTV